MQRSLVAEDLSNGAEAFKLRVVNQYNDDEEVTPPGFEYITAVEQVGMPAKGGEGEQPKLDPYKACKCESACTYECHYDESKNMLRACQPNCTCNSQADPCAVARFTRPSTRFQVFYTPNKGWALQTLEDIKPGQALFEYVGVLSVDQGKKLDDDDDEEKSDSDANKKLDNGNEKSDNDVDEEKSDNDDYIFAFWHRSTRYLLNPHMKGNLARFVNHSCRPNCCPMLVEASARGIPRVLIYSLREFTRAKSW